MRTALNAPHPRLDEFRAWLAGPGLPPALQQAERLRWRLLPGSAVNLRLRVSGTTPTGEQEWFVRFAGNSSAALGAHLAPEALAHAAAAAAGLAPALVHVDIALGVLVSEWWPGKHWRWRQARRGVATFAVLLARLHAVPIPAGLPALDPLKAARQLLAELPFEDHTTNTLHSAAVRAMHSALDRAAPNPADASIQETKRPHASAAPLPQVLVHSDPHAGNLLQAADGSLRLVDFEYAGSGAPVHDLAVFATSHDLSRPQRQTLLAAYAAAGGCSMTPGELAHACGVADALWLAWTARVHGAGWLEQPRARRVAARLAALS